MRPLLTSWLAMPGEQPRPTSMRSLQRRPIVRNPVQDRYPTKIDSHWRAINSSHPSRSTSEKSWSYTASVPDYLVAEVDALVADPSVTGRRHGRDPVPRLSAEAA